MSALTDQIATDFANNELNSNEFAVEATFDGGPGTIKVQFSESAEVESEVDAGVYSMRPIALCLIADVPNPEGKTLVINSVTYYVADDRPNSDYGTTRLTLSRNPVDHG